MKKLIAFIMVIGAAAFGTVHAQTLKVPTVSPTAGYPSAYYNIAPKNLGAGRTEILVQVQSVSKFSDSTTIISWEVFGVDSTVSSTDLILLFQRRKIYHFGDFINFVPAYGDILQKVESIEQVAFTSVNTTVKVRPH